MPGFQAWERQPAPYNGRGLGLFSTRVTMHYYLDKETVEMNHPKNFGGGDEGLHWGRFLAGTCKNTHAGTMVRPDLEQGQAAQTLDRKDPGWLVICWNDPVNLMEFVLHVFMRVFGWSKSKAEFHMLQVHHEGKSVLKQESLERAEFYVHQLQGYGLHATMEQAGS